MQIPFRYFNSSPEVIRLVVMMYNRYPLSLRQVEYLPFERGIDICHETVRFWWNRFGPMFAAGYSLSTDTELDFLFGRLPSFLADLEIAVLRDVEQISVRVV